MEHDNNDNNKKYRCWINREEQILSFSYEEGYELKEFSTHAEFQDYYYKKTYRGYRAQ